MKTMRCLACLHHNTLDPAQHRFNKSWRGSSDSIASHCFGIVP